MFFFVFVCLLSVYSVRGFIPISPLMDCPSISTQNDIKIGDVVGTWRLAYLLIDDNEDFEEDNTCAVAEIMQVNETKLEMLLYVDGRKDEFIIDRYTKEFDVTVLTPGEWLFYTSFAGLEYIHVKVIGFSNKHLILTFCVDQFTSEEKPVSQAAPTNDYDSLLNLMEKDNANDLAKIQNYNKLFREMDDDFGGRLGRQRRIRRPSRLLRGKRNVRNSEELPKEESNYDKLIKFFKSKSGRKPMKHLWTIVLVKDNNTSALRFVENASMLMKYGFKIKEGQLVSFGSCSLNRK